MKRGTISLTMIMLDKIDNWDKFSHPMQRDQFGVYSIFLPNKPDGSPAIKHNTKLKASYHPLLF